MDISQVLNEYFTHLAIQSLHFCTLRSLQKSLETASSTWGSCSHFFIASTLRVFRCGFASISMASAHSWPEVGHSCVIMWEEC